MEAVYPSATSALVRGRRARRPDPRSRHRTVPVTFAEIKEVDEENEEPVSEEAAAAREERRRRPDVQDAGLTRQFAEFRRRRARRDLLRERADESPPPAPSAPPAPAPLASVARAGSEPAAQHAPPAPAPLPSVARAGSEPAAQHAPPAAPTPGLPLGHTCDT